LPFSKLTPTFHPSKIYKMNNLHQENFEVLLVEDEVIVRLVHHRMLSDFGCEVECATDGASAIKMAKNDYDCILMGIGLPDITGIEVTQEIRAYETKNHRKKTKIIALTAYKKEDVKQHCDRVGIDEILNKPLTAQELKEAIEK